MTLQAAIDRYHRALDDFARGDPAPVKSLYSHDGTVSLANPFGSTVRGWEDVSDALDYASSRFRDGRLVGLDRVATFETSDLACILELERWESRVTGREEIAPFQLRVTSVFRRHEGAWMLVHRHADPIGTIDPDGPLRGSGR